MKKNISLLSILAGVICSVCSPQLTTQAAEPAEPPVIDPGPPGGVPSDAVVLFDGKDLSKWKGQAGGDAKWKVVDGCLEVTKTGNILTREDFGDVQLHIEWASPAVVSGEGQGRGNSGIYFQGRYEVQVLDSYNNKTYPDGQAGAIYKIAAPLVNVCRKPGEWQSYDIVFRAPKAGADGKTESGRFTVFQNGVLIQDNVELKGGATTSAAFSGVTPKGPLMLQDHGNPTRYRNIWLRKL